MDPNYLLERFGTQFIWVSIAIIFIECGLLFPILPGDSLLFAMGLFIATGALQINLGVALVALFLAAFLGNVSGYEIGRAIGPPLYQRDGRILKKKYFDQTTVFFDRYGNKALVLGRFVPIVRTFVTVVAGVGKMDRRRFFTWSGVGATLWASGITLLGYFLGQAFPVLRGDPRLAAMIAAQLTRANVANQYRPALSGRSISENDQPHDMESYLDACNVGTAESSTFLWYPWTLALAATAAADKDLPIPVQRQAGKMLRSLTPRLGELQRFANQNEAVYPTAEALLAIAFLKPS